MPVKIMTTQWTEFSSTGSATLIELLDYLKTSNDILIETGGGYHRIDELIEMVRQMNINRSNKL